MCIATFHLFSLPPDSEDYVYIDIYKAVRVARVVVQGDLYIADELIRLTVRDISRGLPRSCRSCLFLFLFPYSTSIKSWSSEFRRI